MQRFARLAILALVFAASVSQAQTSRYTDSNCNRPDYSEAELNLNKAGTDYEVASTNARPFGVMDGFEFLTNIGQGLIKEFDNAWRLSGDGTNGREGVVLIFRMKDGSYRGTSQGFTNEYRKFTLKWNPAAIAIVHTHPNSGNPKPSAQDQLVAEKYDVPIFTLTTHGMYLYNPATNITSKVMDGLDWLNLSRWTQEMSRNADSSLNQVPESGCKQNPVASAASNVNKPPPPLSQVDTKR
jgi:hypothetical protein